MDSLDEWFTAANVDEHNIILDGPDNGRRFMVKVNYTGPGLSLSKFNSLVTMLRINRNEWRKFSCAGGTLHLETDRSEKRRSEEFMARKLAGFLSSQLPPASDGRRAFYVNKRDETGPEIYKDGQAVAQIFCEEKDSPPWVGWSASSGEITGIDRKKAEKELNEFLERPSSSSKPAGTFQRL